MRKKSSVEHTKKQSQENLKSSFKSAIRSPAGFWVLVLFGWLVRGGSALTSPSGGYCVLDATKHWPVGPPCNASSRSSFAMADENSSLHLAALYVDTGPPEGPCLQLSTLVGLPTSSSCFLNTCTSLNHPIAGLPRKWHLLHVHSGFLVTANSFQQTWRDLLLLLHIYLGLILYACVTFAMQYFSSEEPQGSAACDYVHLPQSSTVTFNPASCRNL